MPNTRSRPSPTPEGALDKVLQVLDNEKYNLLFGLAGIKEIYDFLAVETSDLKEVPTTTGNNSVKLNIVELGRIKKIKSWYQHQPPGLETWYKLDKDELNRYLLEQNLPEPQTPRTPVPGTLFTPGYTAGTSNTSNGQMLAGVKRTITDYPRLREDKMWMSFNRSLQALAATHALSEILDPTYEPVVEDYDFKVKNTFMYSVFTYSLLSAKAKVPLRVHEKTKDGQAVYRDLLEAYASGTAKDLSADSLETQLRAMKLDSNWTKSVETFVNTWTTKMYDLESIQDKSVSDSDKRRWFIQSIKSHELYNHITGITTTEQATGTTLDWDKFSNIVLSSAQNIDSTKPPP